MQSSMPSTVIQSKSKPEVEFQYGGRLFFQTGSSYISAIVEYMSIKSVLLIEIDVDPRSAESDIIKYETGSSMEPTRPPS